MTRPQGKLMKLTMYEKGFHDGGLRVLQELTKALATEKEKKIFSALEKWCKFFEKTERIMYGPVTIQPVAPRRNK